MGIFPIYIALDLDIGRSRLFDGKPIGIVSCVYGMPQKIIKAIFHYLMSRDPGFEVDVAFRT